MSEKIEDPCEQCCRSFDRYAFVCPDCGFVRRVQWRRVIVPDLAGRQWGSWETGSRDAPTLSWTTTERHDAIFRMVGAGPAHSFVSLLDDEDQLGVFIYVRYMYEMKTEEIASSLNSRRNAEG